MLYEPWFIIMGNLLGARIFKRYWPVGGSYWNTTHIDKTRRSYNEIINQANNFTQQHVQGFVTMLILGCGAYLIEYWEIVYFMIITTPIHLYAFMIHHYNRILAHGAIAKLSVHTPESPYNMLDSYNDGEMMKIYASKCSSRGYDRDDYTPPITYIPPTLYQLRIHGHEYHDCPYFETIEECERFRTYIKDLCHNNYCQLINMIQKKNLRSYHDDYIKL